MEKLAIGTQMSGHGSKLYTDIQKDIYTYSTWSLYHVNSTDPSAHYYATKVSIYFNKDGKQAVVKQSGANPQESLSLDVAPTNINKTTAWTDSISSGTTVSYKGSKVNVSLTRPNSNTNLWSFSDGTLTNTAYFDNNDIFECVTQWSVLNTHRGNLFFYEESGYDVYASSSPATRTAVYFDLE